MEADTCTEGGGNLKHTANSICHFLTKLPTLRRLLASHYLETLLNLSVSVPRSGPGQMVDSCVTPADQLLLSPPSPPGHQHHKQTSSPLSSSSNLTSNYQTPGEPFRARPRLDIIKDQPVGRPIIALIIVMINSPFPLTRNIL